MKNPLHRSGARHSGPAGAGATSNDVAPDTETKPLALGAKLTQNGVAQGEAVWTEDQPTTPLRVLGPAAIDTEAGPVRPQPGAEASPPTRRRRRWPVVAAATAVIMIGTGAVAYGQARKTIDLDIDGEITRVVTFSGDVSSLLDEQGVEVGPHDKVAPAMTSALHKGDDVVFRSGKKVTYEADGVTHTIWVTDLDAQGALDTLESRGKDVRLLASRSDADGRISLPLVMNVDGPVNLVVDGKTQLIQNAERSAAVVLDSAGVEIGPLDRVSVVRDDTKSPSVSLVVQRVKVDDVTATSEIAFGTEKVTDPNRYKDLPPLVKQKGVVGRRTVVKRVTTVDGKAETTIIVSDTVTAKPVPQIVVRGTKERPKASSSSSSGSSSAAPRASAPVGGDVWARLAQCESGGNPGAVSANGLYHGLYQFSVGTWQAMGGSGLPSRASAAEQTARAKALQARSGWGQWPACSAKLGLR